MTPHEKHEHMALALAVVTKLGLTAKDLYNYAKALAILKEAEDNQTDPREDTAKMTRYRNKQELIGAFQAVEVAAMVEEIIRVEGRLI